MFEVIIFLGGLAVLLGPIAVALLIYRKPVESGRSDRTDKNRRRYYPLKRQKGTAISEFIVVFAVCDIILPVIPAFMIPIIFPSIKWWVGIIILELIGTGLILIYYLVFVFDIEYIELDEHGLEIVHKKNKKRELYSRSSFEEFYERPFRTRYSVTITRGIIFNSNGKKKEVNLDYLGEEGFKVFKDDFYYFLKNGVLPVEESKLQAEESKLPTVESPDTDNSKENGFPNLKDYRSFIFTKKVSYPDLKAHLDEYYELYSDPTSYELNYAVKEIKGTKWIRIEFTLKNQTPEFTPFWEYLNALIWISDKTDTLFAYAFSNVKNNHPVIAKFNTNNPAGDSVLGIMNGRYFEACLPEEKIVWKEVLPPGLDYERYLETNFGFDRRYLSDIFEELPVEKHLEWTLRVTDTEEKIENIRDFIGIVDGAIEEIEDGEEEFIIVSPSEPVNHVTFIQACMDKEPGLMHIEAGLDEKKDQNSLPKILCKDNIEPSECLDIFIAFYQDGKVDTDGWYELGF